MKPGIYNLPTVYRGASYDPIQFTWLDANGNPLDITGWTPFAKSQTIDFAPVILDVVNGITQISLTRLQTAGFALGVETWDWIWVFSDGSRSGPFLSGTVIIKESVTQP